MRSCHASAFQSVLLFSSRVRPSLEKLHWACKTELPGFVDIALLNSFAGACFGRPRHLGCYFLNCHCCAIFVYLILVAFAHFICEIWLAQKLFVQSSFFFILRVCWQHGSDDTLHAHVLTAFKYFVRILFLHFYSLLQRRG